jgi:phosphoenolpyruvate carboxylase
MDAQTDKDLPLKEDTRLLGRLLGDVLRAQTGEEGFARIESIRQTAIRLRRASQSDTAGIKDELAALLNDLPIAQTLDVVRAFSYFSHLANLAEDVHQNRRRRAHAFAGSPPQSGSMAHAFLRLRGADRRRSTARVFRRCAGEPRADRPSDRGSAQEHPRLRAGDRPPAAMARPQRADT